MYQPRDIMVVLDFSGSMNDDSEFKSINTFGKEAIMDGLENMYEELESPDYGGYGIRAAICRDRRCRSRRQDMPQIDVEYRYTKVNVTSTKDLSQRGREVFATAVEVDLHGPVR